MKLKDALRELREETDMQETETLNTLIANTKEQFESLSGDLGDMSNGLKEALKSNNWKKVQEIIDYVDGTKKGIDLYANSLKFIGE